METPVQKSYFTSSLTLAVFLFAFFWLTGSPIAAEQSPETFVGGVIGSTVFPFIPPTVLLLCLWLFGVRWSNRAFFYLALVFAIIGLIGRVSGQV